MHHCGNGIRFLSSSPSRSQTNWDPIVQLSLKQRALVLLENCSSRTHFKQILAQVMRTDLIGQTFPMSRLILFSAVTHPENLDIATVLFDHYTPNPNLYIYKTMISALTSSIGQSAALYNLMLKSGIYPDGHTLLLFLQAPCHMHELKQIHGHAIVTGLSSFNYLPNSLAKMYMEKGDMDLGSRVFRQMCDPDVVSFNIMIVGCSRMGYVSEALGLFHRMVSLGLRPDEITVLGLLQCCWQVGEARMGKSVHAWIERRMLVNNGNSILGNTLLDMYVKSKELRLAKNVFDGFAERDLVSWNTIIAGYAKWGRVELAHQLFDEMPRRDIVSWNSLIAGYAQNGYHSTARILFIDMVAEVCPDNFTVATMVSAAAESGALDQGRWLHGWTVRMHMEVDAFLGSALIDMYCKCGSIDSALAIFRSLTEKDVTVWTAMIGGLAFHGHGNKALEMFSEMQEEVRPNRVTCVAVLAACSHGGLLDEGVRFFKNMKRDYGFEPEIEHYGCMVDLLARSGRIAEAIGFIEMMPVKPSRSMWGAVLNACRGSSGFMEMARRASAELRKLEPEEEGGYVLLSNIYAASGRWSSSDRIRAVMEEEGVKKTAGCSNVVVNGTSHEFIAAEKSHPMWGEEIQSVLMHLDNEMKVGKVFLLE